MRWFYLSPWTHAFCLLGDGYTTILQEIMADGSGAVAHLSRVTVIDTILNAPFVWLARRPVEVIGRTSIEPCKLTLGTSIAQPDPATVRHATFPEPLRDATASVGGLAILDRAVDRSKPRVVFLAAGLRIRKAY